MDTFILDILATVACLEVVAAFLLVRHFVRQRQQESPFTPPCPFCQGGQLHRKKAELLVHKQGKAKYTYYRHECDRCNYFVWSTSAGQRFSLAAAAQPRTASQFLKPSQPLK
jgi:hypothetical protein